MSQIPDGNQVLSSTQSSTEKRWIQLRTKSPGACWLICLQAIPYLIELNWGDFDDTGKYRPQTIMLFNLIRRGVRYQSILFSFETTKD